ncbi:MAG: hypothetical protein K0S54_637 [Alphaproteobacteria bacterium]|jgi:hypothetical protein|nr:hypothetical protein [Alphaproteobacteria bacterium]
MTKGKIFMPISIRRPLQAIAFACISASLLAACGGEQDYPTTNSTEKHLGRPMTDAERAKSGGGLFGPGGITLLGNSGRDQEKRGASGGDGIGVNSFIWRGALDTIAFMPLVSADPFGGVIITDWYQPPEAPGERVKVHILILDRELRADGVRASIFRQRYDQRAGGWIDQTIDPKTTVDLENTILTRARQLRIAQLGS